MDEQKVQTGSASPSASTQLRRRGVIAGAAALVAGVLAKASESVAHAADGQPILQGLQNNATSATSLFKSAADGNVALFVGNTGTGDAIYGNAPANPTAAGVHGVGNGAAGTASFGVSGFSLNNNGVVGSSNAAFGMLGAGPAGGVFGTSSGVNSPGVFGQHTANGRGVWGFSTLFGVYGTATSLSGIGVKGDAVGSGGGTGVAGFSDSGSGVFGTSTSGPAGFFSGNVSITGALTVSGTKSAVVPHPDGTNRRLYCLESPESWFEDYGTGRLQGGKADVRIEDDFLPLVRSDNYLVFLQAEGDCNGLYVTNKTRTGFRVQEQGNGTANIGFTYRILARRRDVVGPRLERVTAPTAPPAEQVRPNVPVAPMLPPQPGAPGR